MKSYAGIKSLLVVVSLFVLAGCGLDMVATGIQVASTAGSTVGGLSDSTFKTEGEVANAAPLKVSLKEAEAVKKVAICSYAEHIKGADEGRIYLAATAALIKELQPVGRFKIISPAVFNKKQKEMGLDLDSRLMTEEESSSVAAKVAKALGCDAVLKIGLKNGKASTGLGFLQYTFIGRTSHPFILSAEVRSAGAAKQLWAQEVNFIYSRSASGLDNASPEEIRAGLMPVVKPLTNNLLASFGFIAAP